MQVQDPNEVKIYNLSCGKSVPEWLDDRKRRKLSQKDVDIRKKIELLQDFDMPGLSTSVKMSKDGQYVLVTGIYKPRVRCYEVSNLSMKFERCFDSEVVTFEMLSDDYSKIVFLQDDRFIEFHSAGGRYYRLRIPKYGRDLKYHYDTCDLLIGGASNQVYRLNLERGQFLKPWDINGSEVNKIAINAFHRLVVLGTKEGKVEAWDPRMKARVGVLDPALHCISHFPQSEEFPSVTSLEFNGGLTLGVGTGSGQILLYDIRSNKPSQTKDHMYNLAIKDIAFHEQRVLSMDSQILKIWNSNDGKLMTFIESGSDTLFNNLCHVPNSGLTFIANENTKVLAYYIPTLAPAPRWCSFLDNLTEELEESKQDTVYDDYKFITKTELHELGLSHLLGTNMLKAYMHGYFIDIRLWRKAKESSEPFKFEEYRRKKIREQLEAERPDRVRLDKLPKVNKELALKLMDESKKTNQKKNKGPNLLEDDRFKALFENPDFQVNPNAEEFRLLNPVVTRLSVDRKKELRNEMLKQSFDLIDEEKPGNNSDVELSGESYEEESSEDEKEWAKEVKKQHRLLRKEKEMAELEIEKQQEVIDNEKRNKLKLFELKTGMDWKVVNHAAPSSNLTLDERLQLETSSTVVHGSNNNKQMTFTYGNNKRKFNMKGKKNEKHTSKTERRKFVRHAPASYQRKSKPWPGKRR